MDGVSPSYAVLRAFCDVAREVSLPIDEPLRFLDAMEQDLHKTRYETYEELEDYMRRSASAVGLMVCDLLELEMDDNLRSCAIDLTQAIHLTGIIRDIGEDLKRERIYIPAEDMRRFSGSEDGLLREEVNRKFVQLLKFEIERARDLYRRADSGLPRLPEAFQPTAKMARVLYSRILDRIEQRSFDVFKGRVRISAPEELMASVRLLTSKPKP